VQLARCCRAHLVLRPAVRKRHVSRTLEREGSVSREHGDPKIGVDLMDFGVELFDADAVAIDCKVERSLGESPCLRLVFECHLSGALLGCIPLLFAL
jgi:hypothetical protein